MYIHTMYIYIYTHIYIYIHTYIYVYPHNGILFSHEKDCLDICAIGDAAYVNYAKWNKSDGERQIPCDITFMWNLKQTEENKQTRKSS